MPKVILFNGPPRSGKDAAASFAVNFFDDDAPVIYYRFAEPLKDAAHSLFGMGGIATESFTDTKSVPNNKFFGLTPREVYIWLSEQAVKPKFGKDFFARIAVNYLSQFDNSVIVISDCGFQEEVDYLVNAFGSDNIDVVYMMRDGFDFCGDSRSYVEHAKARTHIINNNGSFAELKESVHKILKGISDGK